MVLAPYYMSVDEASRKRRAGGVLPITVSLQDTDDPSAWITRPVNLSTLDAADGAAMGSMHELVYAVLSKRLQDVLSPGSGLRDSVLDRLVASSINFRSLNPNFTTGGGRIPTVPPQSGAGSGAYHASLWGPNKDERLPHTLPLPTEDHAPAAGQDNTPVQNKGLLIARLFADLQHHLPMVLFNITSRRYVPSGVGGSSVGRRFRKDGMTVTELVYRVELSVEATAITEDDQSTASLQAVIEAAFGTLRDHVGSGAATTGKTWQLWMPTNLSPNPVTEVDAPWSQGDDKGAKLYTGTVGLEQMQFEAVSYIGRPVDVNLVSDAADVADGATRIALEAGDTASSDEPIRLRIGQATRLVVTNAPVTSDLIVSQGKRVIDVKHPRHGSGVYEIVAKRSGEATIYLYDVGGAVPIMGNPGISTRAGVPVAQRKVVVTTV